MNKRILYVEDCPEGAYIVGKICKKLGVEMHWLPNVPSLNIYPEELLNNFDFAIVDCMGTTSNSKDFLNYNYKHKNIKCIATSAEHTDGFINIPFVHKSEIVEMLKEHYGQ